MAIATAQINPSTEKEKTPKKRTISLEAFLDRYTDREDPYSYEWNNGVVEKTKRTMNRDQLRILQMMGRRFATTQAYKEFGQLASEVDMFLPTENRTRRADIAYLTPKQMREVHKNEPTVCPFVVEIISKNDQINKVQRKTLEYFDNGVQVVWVVFPKLKMVHIYRSAKDITVCMEGDQCSAAPVLPDFEIGVDELLG